MPALAIGVFVDSGAMMGGGGALSVTGMSVEGAAITLTVTPSESLDDVTFYRDATSIDVDSSAPYQYADTALPGTREYRAEIDPSSGPNFFTNTIRLAVAAEMPPLAEPVASGVTIGSTLDFSIVPGVAANFDAHTTSVEYLRDDTDEVVATSVAAGGGNDWPASWDTTGEDEASFSVYARRNWSAGGKLGSVESATYQYVAVSLIDNPWPASVTHAWDFTAANVQRTGTDVTSILADVGGVALAVEDAPQYEATGINSGPSVLLDGSNDTLTADGAVSATSGDGKAWSIGMLLQLPSFAANDAFFSFGNSADNDSRYQARTNNSGVELLSRDDGNATNESVRGNDETLEDLAVHSLIVVKRADDSAEVWIDGTEAASYTPDQTLDPGAAVTLDRLTFGALRLAGGSSAHLAVRLAMLAYGDGQEWSTGDIATIHSVMATRGGI